MPLSYQIDLLDRNDLDAIELEVNPSHDLVRALVRRIKDQEYDIAQIEDEFESLRLSCDPEQWEAVMGKNPSEFKGARKPVEMVSWDDAKSFVKKLSEQTGKEYRLLSEAEWEYMARAGSTTKYPWGDKIDSSKAKYNSRDGSEESTVPVGSYSANAFGVHDTAGNVWEWVEDWKHRNYKDAPTDGSAWLSENEGDCEERVLRGGSWDFLPGYSRSMARIMFSASFRSNSYGFRIARTLSQ